MVWPHHIERWRTFADWESRDIPTDLVLSIIAHESGGRPGVPSSRPSADSADIPSERGGTVHVKNAYGLMQIIPSHVVAWNSNKPRKVTFEDISGDDERATRLQIRIGSSLFASYVHKLHQFDPRAFPGTSPGSATPEQLKLALVAYGIGPGIPGGQKGLIPRLESLKAQGKPLTLDALELAFPKWGYSEQKQRWINRPVAAAKAKWRGYTQNMSESPKSSQPSTALAPRPDVLGGWLLPAVVVGAVFFLGRKTLGLDDLFK